MLGKEELALSKPELVAILLYVPGPSGRIGEEVVGKTRLMKLVFLLLKEMKLELYLSDEPSFEPYKYGPFDAEVYDALDALEELGVIEVGYPEKKEVDEEEEEPPEQYDANTTFRLTEFGLERVKQIAKTVPEVIMDRFVKVKTIYAKMPLLQLLHYVYGRYPEYAALSEANI